MQYSITHIEIALQVYDPILVLRPRVYTRALILARDGAGRPASAARIANVLNLSFASPACAPCAARRCANTKWMPPLVREPSAESEWTAVAAARERGSERISIEAHA